ncbi:MAG: hypothetical protein HN742_36150 [Lentisphaerae bacterium]|nr:hypothetical protein [Lentisphaerota bacterium]MBT4822269.1 hypothetical protein [Lentisphaerota bacterium]MBT5604835.1 hypothetical protein [Lentisphaerota bacterium]MBT7056098.1 hypothetical protein [Lentisphaerota bacterium]MBT7847359.1 hypothetical protein [Lentisphaerota bacterium]
MALQSEELLNRGSLDVSADIECGNAGSIGEPEPGRIEIAPRDDGLPPEIQVRGPISCYNVCVQLSNRANARLPFTLDVTIPAWLIKAGFDYFLRKTYFERPPTTLNWEAIPSSRIAILRDRVRFSMSLEPGEERIFASVPSYPYSACNEGLHALASRPHAKLITIGKSPQGRPIISLRSGTDENKPRVVVTGTLQPGEHAAWAVLAMAEWLLESTAGQAFLNAFRVDLVPQPNPDGNVLGACNVNSAGEMPVFACRDVTEGREAPPETSVLWQYLAQDPPLGYMDFHFLHTPNHATPKVMFPDVSLHHDQKQRELATRVAEAVVDAGECSEVSGWRVGDPLWSQLVVYQATEKLNTIAYLDQYTGPLSSLSGARRRGPVALKTFLEALRQPGRSA